MGGWRALSADVGRQWQRQGWISVGRAHSIAAAPSTALRCMEQHRPRDNPAAPGNHVHPVRQQQQQLSRQAGSPPWLRCQNAGCLPWRRTTASPSSPTPVLHREADGLERREELRRRVAEVAIPLVGAAPLRFACIQCCAGLRPGFPRATQNKHYSCCTALPPPVARCCPPHPPGFPPQPHPTAAALSLFCSHLPRLAALHIHLVPQHHKGEVVRVGGAGLQRQAEGSRQAGEVRGDGLLRWSS